MGVISTETFDQEDNQHDLTHWHDKIEVIRVIDHEMYCAVNGTEHFLHKPEIFTESGKLAEPSHSSGVCAKN